MNPNTPVPKKAMTLTELCRVEDDALNVYLEQKRAFLCKLDEKADARIAEALEKKHMWVA